MTPGMMHVAAILYTAHADEDAQVTPPNPDTTAPHLPWLEPTPHNKNGLPSEEESPSQ